MVMGKPRILPILVASVAASLLLAASAEAGRRLGREYGGGGAAVSGAPAAAYRTGLGKAKGEPGRLRAENPEDIPVAGGPVNPVAGSISLRVKYLGPAEAEGKRADREENLFTLADNTGRPLLSPSVVWPDSADPFARGGGNGGLVVGSAAPASFWGGWIPFDRPVAPGETLRITFSWDNGVNKVYLDGRELTHRHMASVDMAQAGLPDLFPDNVVYGAGDFAPFLARAATLRVGADLTPDTNSPLASGEILSLEIYDRPGVPSGEKPAIRSFGDDSFALPGISGKLVAGDTVTATLVAESGGTATFDLGKVRGIAMAELPVDPGGPGKPAVEKGTYRGSYRIKAGDDFEDGRAVGRFVSADNVAADPVTSASKWTIVTKPVVSFTIDRKELPADSASKSRIVLVAKDANGVPLPGRHLKLTLATTDEYTGLVGAGDFGKEVGGSVETRWKGETDAWGQVEFDYTAGFAAKTAILQVKDLDSGGVAVDFLRSFKEASIDIALTAPRSLAAARRGTLYTMRLQASRTELTADGRSRSVLRATVLDPSGAPVPGEPVAFSLSSANGTIRTIAGTTDKDGTATAEYVAGTKIGIVVITATDTVRNISATVSITLLADAPAKILLKARPESLPADGHSRADVKVTVTDINDNPNKDTLVEFRLARGTGQLESPSKVTDRYGEATERFTAGTTPGVATILATVRSKVPSEVELAKARNVLFVPYNAAEESVRVERWLRKKGEKALLGETVAQYTVGRGTELFNLVAPRDLVIDEILVEGWDKAEVGQSLAIFTPVVTP